MESTAPSTYLLSYKGGLDESLVLPASQLIGYVSNRPSSILVAFLLDSFPFTNLKTFELVH